MQLIGISIATVQKSTGILDILMMITGEYTHCKMCACEGSRMLFKFCSLFSEKEFSVFFGYPTDEIHCGKSPTPPMITAAAMGYDDKGLLPTTGLLGILSFLVLIK